MNDSIKNKKKSIEFFSPMYSRRRELTKFLQSGVLLDGLYPPFFFAIVKSGSNWQVNELFTGMTITNGEKTRKGAIDNARALLEENGFDAILKRIKEVIQQIGYEPNPEYAFEYENTDIARNPIKSIDRRKRPIIRRELFRPIMRKKDSTKVDSFRHFEPAPTSRILFYMLKLNKNKQAFRVYKSGVLLSDLYPPFNIAITKEKGMWIVVELATGRTLVSNEKVRKSAIDKALARLQELGIEGNLKNIDEFIKKFGFAVNPEYVPDIVNADISKNPTKSIDRSKRPMRKSELFEPTKRKISSAKGAKTRNFQPATTTPEPTTTTIKPPKKQSTMANSNALKKYNARVAELVAQGKSRADARKQVSQETAKAKEKNKTKKKAQISRRNAIASREIKEVKSRVTLLEKQAAASCAVRKPRTKKAKTTVA